MQRARSSQGGFGLVEVLVALVLLAVGMLSLGRFQGVEMNNISSTRNHSQAVGLAQAKLEALRDYKGAAEYAALVTGADEAPIRGENTSYRRSWVVHTFTLPSYKQVDVRVSWSDVLGESREVRLGSYIGYQDPLASRRELGKLGGLDEGNGGDDDGSEGVDNRGGGGGGRNAVGGSGNGNHRGNRAVSCTCQFRNHGGYALQSSVGSCCSVSGCQSSRDDPDNNAYWQYACQTE